LKRRPSHNLNHGKRHRLFSPEMALDLEGRSFSRWGKRAEKANGRGILSRTEGAKSGEGKEKGQESDCGGLARNNERGDGRRGLVRNKTISPIREWGT